MRPRSTVVLCATGLLLAGCGGSGRAGNPDPTVPPDELVGSTVAATPVPQTMGTTPTTTASAATPVPQTMGTSPPNRPTDPPSAAGGADPTAAAPLPTAGTTALQAPRVVPPECSPGDIARSTGMQVLGLSCRAGWATATLNPCAAGQSCGQREVFHISGDGAGRVEWVHIGAFDATCAETLAAAGMTVGTASYLAPVCDRGAIEPATNIPPGSQDPRVPALQVALIAVGYDIALDGTYGPGTEAAVRDFQRQTGLEVDGIAGPNTQASLGM